MDITLIVKWIVDPMSFQTLQNISQIIIAVGLVLAALGGLGNYIFGERAKQEKDAKQAYVGKLEPRRQMVLSGKQHIFPEFEFADSGSRLAFTGEKGLPLFKIAEDNDITIEVEDDQVKVSTVIRGKNGQIVAQIVKNEWKVNPNNVWDRNYSKDALEVKDPRGDIVLQVKLVQNRVQFQAKLYDSNGRGVAFGKIRGPNGWGGIIELTGSSHPHLTLKIQPLFKYPSNLHLGQFLATRDRS